MTITGIVLAFAAYVLAFAFYAYWTYPRDRAEPAKLTSPTKQSVRCQPETIDPRIGAGRGLCGIRGCRIAVKHSHIEDLIRRMQEPRNK